MTNEDKLGKLKRIHATKGQHYVVDFENALIEIISLNDPSLTKQLFYFFEDDAEYDEPLWLIVSYVENLPIPAYLSEIVYGSPLLLSRSSEWAERMFMRLLNSDNARTQLRAFLCACKDDRSLQAVSTILNRIATTRPQFTDRVRSMLDGEN